MNQIVKLQTAMTEIRPRVQALIAPAGREAALKMLALVIGSYRTSYDEPKVFARQASAALEDFPADILEELANPKVGIIRELKFAPSIAELVAWCERRQGEKVAALAQTDAERAAIFHAAERGEGWAVRYFKLRGVTI